MDVSRRRLHFDTEFLFAITGHSGLCGLSDGSGRTGRPALRFLLLLIAVLVSATSASAVSCAAMACALQVTNTGDVGDRSGDHPGDDVPPSVPAPESTESASTERGEQLEPLSEMTLEKVIAAWKSREAAVRSFEFSWTTRYPIEVPNTQLRDAATLYPEQFHKLVDGQYLIVKPGCFLHRKRSWYTKDVGNERVVVVTSSFDGRESVRIGDAGLSGVSPSAELSTVDNERFFLNSPLVQSSELESIMVSLWPFAENKGVERAPLAFIVKPDDWQEAKLTEQIREVAGNRCRVLEVTQIPRGKTINPVKMAEFAIGAGPDYPVLEIARFHWGSSQLSPPEGTPVMQTVVWKTAAHPIARVIPLEWTITEFDPQNSEGIPRFKTTEIVVTTFEINGDYPDSRFSQRPFPPGTVITSENGVTRQVPGSTPSVNGSSESGIVISPDHPLLRRDREGKEAAKEAAKWVDFWEQSVLFQRVVWVPVATTLATLIGYLLLSRFWTSSRSDNRQSHSSAAGSDE